MILVFSASSPDAIPYFTPVPVKSLMNFLPVRANNANYFFAGFSQCRGIAGMTIRWRNKASPENKKTK
jgi:hypothetical protein